VAPAPRVGPSLCYTFVLGQRSPDPSSGPPQNPKNNRPRTRLSVRTPPLRMSGWHQFSLLRDPARGSDSSEPQRTLTATRWAAGQTRSPGQRPTRTIPKPRRPAIAAPPGSIKPGFHSLGPSRRPPARQGPAILHPRQGPAIYNGQPPPGRNCVHIIGPMCGGSRLCPAALQRPGGAAASGGRSRTGTAASPAATPGWSGRRLSDKASPAATPGRSGAAGVFRTRPRRGFERASLSRSA
jgi:hypothetical protein